MPLVFWGSGGRVGISASPAQIFRVCPQEPGLGDMFLCGEGDDS